MKQARTDAQRAYDREWKRRARTDSSFRERQKDILRRSYLKNREKRLAEKRDYWVKNKENIRLSRSANAEKYKKTRRARLAERRCDPIFRLKKNVSGRVLIAIKRGGWKKSERTSSILGCNWECLKSHIESKFSAGMTWGNQGEWHIDHIVPLCTAKTVDDVYRLCHYTNLQPLWADDNIRKGGKYV